MVEIHPDPSGLVLIGGENGAGKTSVLDSIMWALAGGKSIQPVPIRDGETTAEIRLDLGDLIVVRRFTASGSTVKVSTKDGATYSSPQQILDAMVAKLAFDPLAFTKLKPEEQGRALAELVGLETVEIDSEIERLYKERTEANRDVQRLAATISSRWKVDPESEALPELAAKAPEQEPDLKGLISEKAAADRVRDLIQANAVAIDAAEREAERLAGELKGLASELAELSPVVDGEISKVRTDANAERLAARSRFDAKLKQLGEEHAAEVREINRREELVVQNLETGRQGTQKRLETREQNLGAARQAAEDQIATLRGQEFQAVRPVAEIVAEIEAAESSARAFYARQNFEADRKAWEASRDGSKALSERIDALREKRRELLAAVKFPVEGLAVTESGGVTFDGVPFVQASQAQQIRASVGIGLASNPELKVLLIREGALLGRDSLALVGQMAAEHGAQIWVERVGDGDASAVIIEDGHVRGVEPAEPEAAEPVKKKRRGRRTETNIVDPDETTGVSLAEMAQEPGNGGNSLDDEGRDAVRRQSELRDG